MKVYGVATKGRANANWWFTAYSVDLFLGLRSTVMYEKDTMLEEFRGNTDKDTLVSREFSAPSLARLMYVCETCMCMYCVQQDWYISEFQVKKRCIRTGMIVEHFPSVCVCVCVCVMCTNTCVYINVCLYVCMCEYASIHTCT
jgi:hypothetical protein